MWIILAIKTTRRINPLQYSLTYEKTLQSWTGAESTAEYGKLYPVWNSHGGLCFFRMFEVLGVLGALGNDLGILGRICKRSWRITGLGIAKLRGMERWILAIGEGSKKERSVRTYSAVAETWKRSWRDWDRVWWGRWEMRDDLIRWWDPWQLCSVILAYPWPSPGAGDGMDMQNGWDIWIEHISWIRNKKTNTQE